MSAATTRIRLVFRGKTLVLKKKGKEGWEFPGGRVEEGEIPIDCIKRELFEETGIPPRAVVLTSIGEYEMKSNRGTITMYMFGGVMENNKFPQVVLSSEHVDFEWVITSDLHKYGLPENPIPQTQTA